MSRLLHFVFAITFFTSGLFINFVQLVLYLSLRPLNKRLYRKINWYLCYAIYSQLVFVADWWSGLDLVIFADKNDFDKYYGKEHIYGVMNHTYEIDWLLMLAVADRVHLLGNCKAYVKKALQYMPVIGWAWKLSDFVILERSYNKDKEIINKQIKELTDYPDPMWLVVLPEGTRFTSEKHKASEDFARQGNLPELKYHLQPRTKGFTTSLPSMKGKVSAILDILLAFKEDDPVKPSVTNLLMGKRLTAYLYMHRIPMENVPTSEVEQEKFLRDMFVRKDKMKDSFVQTGDFFTTSGVSRVTPFRINRRIYPLINVITWTILTLCPIVYLFISLLFTGQLFYFSIGASIILCFIALFNKAVSMSEISKGSSYGITSTPQKTE